MTHEQNAARIEALKLLRRYDRLKAELRTLEPQLHAACNAYARIAKGTPFMRPETLRWEAEITAEQARKKAA